MASDSGYFVTQVNGRCQLFYNSNPAWSFSEKHGAPTCYRRFRNIYDAMSFMFDPGDYFPEPKAYRIKKGKVLSGKKNLLEGASSTYNVTVFRLCTSRSETLLREDVRLYGRARLWLEDFSLPTILARRYTLKQGQAYVELVPIETNAAEAPAKPAKASPASPHLREWYCLYADASVLRPVRKEDPALCGYGVVCLNPNGSELFQFNMHMEVEGEKACKTQYHELKAIVLGLEHFREPTCIRVYTDQKPFITGLSKGFLFSKYMAIKKGEPVDPMLRKLIGYIFFHNIEFRYVESHNGNIYHDRCDYLASPKSLICQ